MADDIARFGAELEVSKLRRDVTTAMNQLKKLDRQADKTSRGVKGIGSSAKSLAVAFAGVAAAAVGVGAAAVGLGFMGKKLFDIGASAAETESKFRTVFGSFADSVDEFGQSFGRMAGMSKTATQEVLATTGAIVQGMGFSQKASAGFSQEIVKLAGDLASFNNIPTAETARAIQSALTGERESLKRLGVVILETDVQKQALVETGKENAKQLTQEEKALATLTLITERSGVAMGDLVRTQDSAANRAKQLKARFEDLKQEFATSLMPALEELIGPLETLIGKAEGFAAALSKIVVASLGLVGIRAAIESPMGRVEALFPDLLLPQQKEGRPSALHDPGLPLSAPEQLLEDFVTEALSLERRLLDEQEVGISDGERARRALVNLTLNRRLNDLSEAVRLLTNTIALSNEIESVPVAGEFPFHLTPRGMAVTAGQPGLQPLGEARLPPEVQAALDAQDREKTMVEKIRRHEQLLSDAWEGAGDAGEDAARRTGLAWEQAAILGVGRLVEQLIRGGGGVGGFLGSLGGIIGGLVSSVNPLAGAGILAGSGVISAALSGSDAIDPSPVRVMSYSDEALSQRERGRGGPETVTIQIIRSDTGLLEAEYELNRATSRDAFVRIPVGASVNG
jgi:hypothetical protein